MERKSENQGSIWMMIVGVLFIVVAGTIFVSKAWPYLPDVAKWMVLAALSGGFFFGAFKLTDRENMKKTQAVLYYLAVAFSGLCILSVADGLFFEGKHGWSYEALVIASATMTVLIAVRFLNKKGVIDLVLLSLLSGSTFYYIENLTDFTWLGIFIFSTIELTLYILADYYRRMWIDNNYKLDKTFGVLLALNAIKYTFFNTLVIVFENRWDASVHVFVLGVMFIIATSVLYNNRKQSFFRVLNSIAWFAGAFDFVFLIDTYTDVLVHDRSPQFIIFLLICIITAVFLRKEMKYFIIGLGVIIPVIQADDVIGYGMNEIFLYPYSLVFLLAMIVIIYRQYKKGDYSAETVKNYIYAGIVQAVISIFVMFAGEFEIMYEGLRFVLVLQFLAISFLCKDKALRKTFQTMALFGAELILIDSNVFIIDGYSVESICAYFAIGALLLGCIFERSSCLEAIQFVINSLLLVTMLLNAIGASGVEHSIIVGLVGVAILVAASIKQNRKYAILSSVVLILLVLDVTCSFWLAIEWWVYLFVVGVALVTYAIRREVKTGKNGNVIETSASCGDSTNMID